MSEKVESSESIFEIYDRFIQSGPKLVANFVPDNAKSQKQAFLYGLICNPHHHYTKLQSINFEDETAKLEFYGRNLLAHPDMSPKRRPLYEELILLEINRSPQFSRYNEMMGINLADKLMKGLV